MFLTTEEEAELGKWFKLGKFAEVKVRRFSSKKSRAVREALERKYGLNNTTRVSLGKDDQEELNIQHIAKGILVDWKGVKDAAGNDVKFTTEAAVQYLTKLPELRELIAQLSLDIANFRKAANEEIEGN